MRTKLATVLALAVVACSQGNGSGVSQQGTPANEAAAVRSAIEAGNAGLIAAMERGDMRAAASFYDPDAMSMPQGLNAAVGRSAIESVFTSIGSAMKVRDMKLEIRDVVTSGDLAVETGHYEWTFVPAKGPSASDKGKYVVAWRRQADGSWKLFRDIFNNDAPAKPPAK